MSQLKTNKLKRVADATKQTFNYFIFEQVNQFTKNYNTFYPNCHQALKNMAWDPGSRKNQFRIPNPGVKKATDPGSGKLVLQSSDKKLASKRCQSTTLVFPLKKGFGRCTCTPPPHSAHLNNTCDPSTSLLPGPAVNPPLSLLFFISQCAAKLALK